MNKSICLWVFCKKSQKFLKICREEPVLETLFIVKLQRGIACKKTKVKFPRLTLRDAYLEILTPVLLCKF